MPEIQMPWGGGGFNPAYAGGAAVAAGAGAVAATGSYREQNQETPPPRGTFQLPQSVSYSPHVVAAAAAGARRPGSDSGTSPTDWHVPTVADETSGGTGTSLPYARDGSGHSPPSPTASDNPYARRHAGPSVAGWNGAPEIQR